MKRLSELSNNRNNNFNLIRLIAAITVLIGHCYPLTTGREANFWIGHHLGISLGSIAVDAFFITSGFLVTGSLLSRKDTLSFISARILRVYPGLIVMVLITTLIIGTYFTNLHPTDYLASRDTLWYFMKNVSIITGATYTLPGVFGSNPFKGSVNGSLWTLPYEIWMYSTLILVWFALSISPETRINIFKVVIVVLALASLIAYNYISVSDTSYYQFIKLFSMFFSGAAYFVLQKRIPLSLPLFCLMAIALGISTLDKDFFQISYSLCLTYLLMCIAYLPNGGIRSFNRIGDYSYGVYIYAFPIQQSVAASIPGISVSGMFQISLFITLIFAVCSWHFIEKPSLALKFALSGRYSSL